MDGASVSLSDACSSTEIEVVSHDTNDRRVYSYIHKSSVHF